MYKFWELNTHLHKNVFVADKVPVRKKDVGLNVTIHYFEAIICDIKYQNLLKLHPIAGL